MISFKEFQKLAEDAPTNAVGNGAVAATNGQDPVIKKNQKNKYLGMLRRPQIK